MIKVLCSTGALITRYNGRDPRLLHKLISRIESDGFEFMIYPSWDEKLPEVVGTMRRLIADDGAFIPVIHMDKRIGELLSEGGEANVLEARSRYSRCCDIACELGAKLLVLHLWGGPASDHHIDRNIAELPGFMEEAGSKGLELTVENVICGVSTPLAHIRRIMDELPGARFTIDTKMAEFHRELPETLAEEALWQGRVSHLHVNDYAGGYRDFTDLRVRHIGEGHVDFTPFYSRVKQSGYAGFATVESTSVLPDGTVDLPRLNNSLRKVREGLNGE